MNASRITLVASLAAAFLAGCASDVPLPNSGTGAPVVDRSTGSGTGSGTGSSSGIAPVDLTKNNTAPATVSRIVYFDYDSFVVKDEFRPLIEAQSKVLTSDRKKKVSIEGHTDERGGSEYNLALGQKRAEAVAKTLTLLGVNDSQVEAVSFGKERPAVQGSDEAAYAKNRRAELNAR
jgi:peptidoglycan-associated lipoprotein